MTEWDKLWNSDIRKEVWTAEHDWFIGDWIAEVKTEGNRLKKEGLEHYAIAVEYYERLEAVKEVFNEMYHDYMNSKTTPLVSNYIPRFVHCLSEFRNKGEDKDEG